MPCCRHRSRPSASFSHPSFCRNAGGNGYVIHFGHRRVAQAIAADLTEIRVLVADSDADHDAMRTRRKTSRASRSTPSTSGARSSVLWRLAGPKSRLRWRLRCRCARSASQAARQRAAGDARSDGEGRPARRAAAPHYRRGVDRRAERGLEEIQGGKQIRRSPGTTSPAP